MKQQPRNKIEQLILRLCPDGVKSVNLGEVCKIYDGTHQTPKYTNEGVRFVSVENINELYKSNKYISRSDFDALYKVKPRVNDVFMTRIGSIGVCTVIESDEELAYYVTLTLIRPDLSKIDPKYLKYIIESSHGQKELRKRTLVNATPIKINLGEIGKIEIPLPPLEVQGEIVKILNKYSELEAELEAEIEAEIKARKKQYEHYKTDLLTLDKGVNSRRIDEICQINRGRVISKDYLRENPGEYPVYSSQTVDDGVFGRINTYDYDGEYLTWTTDGANAGSVFYRNNKFNITNVCGLLKIKDSSVMPKYLYYALAQVAKKYVSSGMGNPKIMSSAMEKITVPVPTHKEQLHIVNTLDKFDALVNDILDGLPAELNARRQQYEYYRNKLLTFKELKN